MSDTITQPIVTDEQVDGIFAELLTFGADKQDKAEFQRAVNNPENYWDGYFEWTDRLIGVRVSIHRRHRSDAAHIATIFEHGIALASDEEFAAADARIKALFA